MGYRFDVISFWDWLGFSAHISRYPYFKGVVATCQVQSSGLFFTDAAQPNGHPQREGIGATAVEKW